MAHYLVIKNIKSGTKATSKFLFTDLLFIFVYVGSGLFIQSLISSTLLIVFHLFNFIIALLLISKSKVNPGKRYYHSVYYYLIRNISTYHPVPNESKNILKGEMLNELKKER